MGRFFLIQSVSATLSRSWSENLIPNLGGKVRLAIVETTGSKVEGVRQSVAGGLELSRLRECPMRRLPLAHCDGKSQSLRQHEKGFAKRYIW